MMSGIRRCHDHYGQNETDGHYVTLKVPQATQQAFEYLTSFGTVVNDASPPTPMSTSTGTLTNIQADAR